MQTQDHLHVFVDEQTGSNHFLLDEKRGLFRTDEPLLQKVAGQAQQPGHPVSYQLKTWYLCPRIVRIEGNGPGNVIFRSPLFQCIFNAPFPALLFVAGGIVIKGSRRRFSEKP